MFSACLDTKKVQYRKEPSKGSDIYDCYEHSPGTNSSCTTSCARHANAPAGAGNACSTCRARRAYSPGSASEYGSSGGSGTNAYGAGSYAGASARRRTDASSRSSPCFPGSRHAWSAGYGSSESADLPGRCTSGSCYAWSARSPGSSGGPFRHSSFSTPRCSQTGDAGA